jgi:hypothetical protein
MTFVCLGICNFNLNFVSVTVYLIRNMKCDIQFGYSLECIDEDFNRDRFVTRCNERLIPCCRWCTNMLPSDIVHLYKYFECSVSLHVHVSFHILPLILLPL